MMAFNLLPREDRFFVLFDNQADNILKGARFYKELAECGQFDEKNIRLMHDIEHECDANTHSIIELLNKTFITPFDREDIHELAEQLDNIMDTMYSTIKRIRLYLITGIHEDIIRFAAYVEDSAAAVGRAISGLRTSKKTAPIYEACSQVKMIENQGDQLHDTIIGRLLASKGDAIEFVKWKEIINGNEKILDFCKDTVKVIESILVKQG
jgi:uncharacterized protein